jgi:protein-S-isoprenylcysteine O-methyltransferase Ste14
MTSPGSPPFLIPPTSHARLTLRGRREAIRLGHFLFGYRDYLVPLAFVLLTLTTSPEFLFGSARLDPWLDGIGIVVALTGQVLRVLVIGFAYIKRGGYRKRIAADKLVREGFFAHSRNPLYLGNLLILFGLVLIANNRWWYLLAFPAFLLAYRAIIMAEEDFLTQKFGREYEEYCLQVNRLIPHFTGLRQSLSAFVFDWKRVIQKEYGSTFTWMSMSVFLLIWERWKSFGYMARRAEIHSLLWCFPFLGMAYLVARWLKKTGRLGGL